MSDHSAMAALLDQKKQQSNAPPRWDLLLSASQKNDVATVVRLLDEEGVPPSHSNVVGQTALHIASLWGCVECLETLIDAGADVNAQNHIAKMTPLHCAIRGTFQSFSETHPQRLRCVKLLLEAGANARICDKKGQDALGVVDEAVREALLKDTGGDVGRDMGEMRAALEGAGANASPLGACIEAADAEGVARLIGGGEEGGAAEVTPKQLNQGILQATEKFKTLVDDDSTDANAFKSLNAIILCLLEAGADVNSHPPMSNTPNPLEGAPLHLIVASVCAAQSRSAAFATGIVRDLLARGAKTQSSTMALLPKCAHRGDVCSVRFLVDAAGIDPNYRGRQGMSGLILAARSGRTEVIQALLAYDVLDPGLTDDAGKTALDYARANGKRAIADLLEGRS